VNEAVAQSLAAQLPTLSRVVDPPTGDLTWGTDLSCVTDLHPALLEVDAKSPRAITEAVTRRYLTPRGALLDDAGYGLDVRSYLSRGVTQRDLRAITGALGGEAQKDDRVTSAEVSMRSVVGSAQAQLQVIITPADPELEQFDFVFSASSGEALTVTIDA
jgi:hypothetical protein